MYKVRTLRLVVTIEVDAHGKDPVEEGQELMEAINAAIKDFTGAPLVSWWIPHGSADVEAEYIAPSK